MRVLHITDTYLPHLGGIEVLVDDLATHQRRAGHQVQVLTSTTSPDPDDAETVRLSSALFSRAADRLHAFGPDAVHCHSSIVSPLAWRTARQAAAKGIPVLVTMHSMVPRQGLVPATLRQLAQAMPDTVTWSAVSSPAARALQPIVGRDVLVLPNGLDQDSCQAASPGTHPVPLIVSVMRLAHRKRPLELVAILARMRDQLGERPWRAAIVGDGPLRSATAQAIRRAGLQEHVELTGRLSRPQIMRLLSQADVYLAPAYLESFGIAALEARCSGLPVVAMSSGGVSEFIGDRTHGHLVRNDAEMAWRTARMLADPAGLQAMSRRSLADPPELGWSDVVDRSLDAYRVAGIRASVPVSTPTRLLVGNA